MLKLSTSSPSIGDKNVSEKTRQERAVKNGRIAPNLRQRRKASRRVLIDARQERNAIESILKLPAAGESVHLVIDGRFEPCDLIPATRRLSDPATIKRLDISTLGFNVNNVATICRGIDQGKIGECLLICSHYFARAEQPAYEYLQKEIGERGGRVAALRTHAKLILMEMTDGNWLTVEGSGNLRACRSIEQFCITNDRDLLLFHRGWMEDYLASATK